MKCAPRRAGEGVRHLVVWIRAALLVAAAVCLGLGVVLPLMRFESFYVLASDAALVDIVWQLWSGGDRLLAVLVGAVSIAFPAAKLVVVAAEAMEMTAQRGGRDAWLGRVVPVLSRWSMTDVLLVAIVIFAVKTGGLAEAFTQPGLWFYVASSLLVLILHHLPDRSRSSN